MLIAVLILTYIISRSKLGYYLNPGGEEPEAAMALGVNVAPAKLIAMAMNSFLTALAGTFYAQFTLYIHPKSIISLDLSFELAFIALIGGRGSIAGPILGALLLRHEVDDMIQVLKPIRDQGTTIFCHRTHHAGYHGPVRSYSRHPFGKKIADHHHVQISFR